MVGFVGLEEKNKKKLVNQKKYCMFIIEGILFFIAIIYIDINV